MTIEANVVRVIVEIRFGICGSVLLKEIVEKLNEGQNKDYSSRFIGGIMGMIFILAISSNPFPQPFKTIVS